LTAELRKYCSKVEQLPFTHASKREPGRILEGTNIRGYVNGTKKPEKRILLCAHWDTRPFADRDPRPENRMTPILGANDGASGVAVLLEVARLLCERPPSVGVDLVFFDLEDMGEEGGVERAEGRDPFCIGSSVFVGQHPDYRPDFGILLDMVGKRDLRIRKEGFSLDRAPRIVEKVWSTARRIGAKAFVDQRGMPVYDDHVPFLERGIPVIDLIDMDYPQWHTLADTPDRCAPESLQQVGDVLVEVIYGG
jgi:Zn-dependent M28 family amino/carboxypeptidase